MDWIDFIITGEETKFDLVLPTFTVTMQQFQGNFLQRLKPYSLKSLTSFAQLEPSKSSSAPPPPGGGAGGGGGGGGAGPPRPPGGAGAGAGGGGGAGPPRPPGGAGAGAGGATTTASGGRGAAAVPSLSSSLGASATPSFSTLTRPNYSPTTLHSTFYKPLPSSSTFSATTTAAPQAAATPPLSSSLGASATAAAGGIGAGGATTATSLPLVSPFNSPSGATLAPPPTKPSAAATTLAPPPTKPSSAAAAAVPLPSHLGAAAATTLAPPPTKPSSAAAAAVPLPSPLGATTTAASPTKPSSAAAAAVPLPSPLGATTTAPSPTKPSAAASPADTAAPLAAATTPTTTPPPPPPPGSPTKIIDAGSDLPGRKRNQIMIIIAKGNEFRWNDKNYKVLSGEIDKLYGWFKKMIVEDDDGKEYYVELDNSAKISFMRESGTPPGTPPTTTAAPPAAATVPLSTRPSATTTAAPPAAAAVPLPTRPSAAGSTDLSTIVPDTLQNLNTWINKESIAVTETDQDKILKKRTDKYNSVKYIFLQEAENIGTPKDKFDYAKTLEVLDQYKMIKNTGGGRNDCLIISFLMSVSLDYRKLDYDQKYSIASKFRRETLPTLITSKKTLLKISDMKLSEVINDLKSTTMLKDDQIGILVNLYNINILSLESYKEETFEGEIYKDYPKAHRIVPDRDISGSANEFGLDIQGIIIINRGNFHYESVKKEPDQYIFSKDELNALYKSVMQNNKYFKLLKDSAPFPPSASSAVAATAANAAATSSASSAANAAATSPLALSAANAAATSSASSAANAAATSPLALSAANAAATSAPSLLKNTQDNKYCTDNKPPFIRIDECKVGAYGYNEQTLDKYIMEHNIGKKVETIKGKRYLKAYRSEKMEWANENPLTRVGLYKARMKDFFTKSGSLAIANASRPTTQAEWRLWGNEPSIGINLTTGIGGALTYGLQSLEQGNPFFSLKTFYIDIDKTQNVLSIITECTWAQITCDQEANTTYDLIVHQDPDNQEINILDKGRDKVKKITSTRYQVREDGNGGDEYVEMEETIIMDRIPSPT